MRLEELRGERVTRSDGFTFRWDEQEITAYPGETILGALIASDIHTLRSTRFEHEPRGMLCAIGVCYECLVNVDGKPNRRACVTPAAPGMIVRPEGQDEEMRYDAAE
jgi:predicted molibdopterin-dependent oxidoreductase YjgC